jgi:cytochrome c biogenesis protein CcdA
MLDARLSTAFLAGLIAAINPCGFVLLPTYLMYFLGLTGRPGSQRSTLRRALLVSAALSTGFLAVFLVVGTISRLFTSWINENAKYVSLVVGIALVILGIAMLFGYRLPLTTPKLDAGGDDRTVWSMFVFGIAYAVASIGCTIGPFTAVVLGTITTDGFGKGLTAIGMYALAMSLVVTGLTVSLALAQGWMLRFLRSGMRYVEIASASLMVLAGLYLTWYWYNDIRQNYSDDVTGQVVGWQSDLENWVRDNQTAVVVVLAVAVLGAITYVVATRHRGDGSAPSEPFTG